MQSKVFLAATLACVFVVISSQDFAFPENEQDKQTSNKDNRKPLYIPGRCPENQLLYPGDQKDDWICDCRPAYIYYPANDTCYAAYRQGPCNNEEFLVLESKQYIPVCAQNPCKQDGFVRYRKICHKLNMPEGPCPPVNAGGGILGVNATTMRLGCLKTVDNVLSLITVPTRDCPLGSRRNSLGQCRKE